VLLAELDEGELERTLREAPPVAHTHRSVTDLGAFRSLLECVRRRGWAMTDEELELGLRAIAAPIRDASGEVVAALAISSSTSRVTVEDLQDRCLPSLLAVAARISAGLGDRP
jgi:IclR family pca regulon transcriptional regulator